jgi:hypothetical protein
MYPGIFSRAQILILAIAILVGAGCSSAPKTARESRVKWFAHCDTCKWRKGSFSTSQDAQEAVTNHNKELHDWYKVAYYFQAKSAVPTR